LGLVESVCAALASPIRSLVAVHLRHPSANDRELVELGTRLRRLTADAGAWLVINRRADLALVLAADGVHLPEGGLDIADVRQLSSTLAIGLSRHDAVGVREAGGADYVFLSPVHPVPGKGRPLGAAGFDALARRSPLPVIALGGMTPDRIRELRHASGVAVIRSVLHSADPGEAMHALDLAITESG
jgi:thiamine-phosphate pyrophosphorylase